MALVRPPQHELNSPSTNGFSTDNALAEQSSLLLEKPEKERVHQSPPHELNPPSADEISIDNVEKLDLH